MKKSYIVPLVKVACMDAEETVLTGSTNTITIESTATESTGDWGAAQSHSANFSDFDDEE